MANSKRAASNGWLRAFFLPTKEYDICREVKDIGKAKSIGDRVGVEANVCIM